MSDKVLAWTEAGWEDYLYWQTQDRKTLKRIDAVNRLAYIADDRAVTILQAGYHY